jgi:uncharacterized protein involved in exopolysaccharide biosynthesis
MTTLIDSGIRVTQGGEQAGRDEAMNLFDIWAILRRGKWLMIVVTTVCVALAVAYALTAQVWYRSEVLLKLADNKQAQGLLGQLGGGLGGLASFAGLDVGGNKSAESVAVLKSREFAAAFIKDKNLLPLFFVKEWDASAQRWKSSDPEKQPDVRDGVEYFHDKILTVEEDKKTGLIKMAVEWTDAKTAAAWANLMVERVNDVMRQRAIKEGEATMAYLKEELAGSNVVTVQQSVGRVIENELQKLMLAKANEEYAFRIIDHAEVPRRRDHPKRSLIVASALILGLAMSGVFLVWRHAIRRRRAFDGDVRSSELR